MIFEVSKVECACSTGGKGRAGTGYFSVVRDSMSELEDRSKLSVQLDRETLLHVPGLIMR